MLTQEKLKSVLTYDPTTGDFHRKVSPSNRFAAGSEAGHKSPRGYLIIGIDRRYYGAHRLAWLYVHGQFPVGDLDHIDRNKLNNRISNLRVAAASQNQANRNVNKNNSTGYRGVSFHRRLGKFGASIRVNFKPKHLGYFDTAAEAGAAADKARVDAFGAFAANYNAATTEIARKATKRKPVNAE